jgi:hypothetical protein
MRKGNYLRHEDKAQLLPVEGREHIDVLLAWEWSGGHFHIAG